MAVKGCVMVNSFVFDNGEIALSLSMQEENNQGAGIAYGPYPASQINDANVVSFAKTYMNENWNANIGLLDTVKLINSIGGLL